MNKITNFRGKNILLKLSFFYIAFLAMQSFAIAEVSAEEAKVEEVAPAEAAGSGASVEDGAKLFKANCASCHSIGANKQVGPGLQGVDERHSEEWLIKWIQNSGKLIASGDAAAIAIYEEYNKSIMPPQTVSADEIRSILAYIKNPPVKAAAAGPASEDLANDPGEDNSNAMFVVVALLVAVLIGLLMFLNKTRAIIAQKNAKDNGEEYQGPVSLWEALKHVMANNQGIVAVVVIVLLFGGLVDTMDGAFGIGVHEGYKPEQPIKFSHKIHAGDDQIDCNYCHSGARHSKSAGIPSLNLCMNCHKYIDGGENTFVYDGEEYPMKDEIAKIYAHLDYDPATQEYGDNQTPAKWIKVHNLPDHVFFSHSQHVVAGKQECQKCHGPVEEMDVLKQNAPLTMKWCIECHKETAVSTKDNGYYDDMHARMTEEYKNNVMEDGKITVNEIGGWECAKCHY